MKLVYPFSAIVGQKTMKQALILTAIDPLIGGVLVFGERGTGKSTIVRSLAALLPKINVVKGCPYNCENLCDNFSYCKNSLKKYSVYVFEYRVNEKLKSFKEVNKLVEKCLSRNFNRNDALKLFKSNKVAGLFLTLGSMSKFLEMV